jgi:hypothetical protein
MRNAPLVISDPFPLIPVLASSAGATTFGSKKLAVAGPGKAMLSLVM